MNNEKANGVLVIPALNPEPKFKELAVEMSGYFSDVIVVDDGSDAAHKQVFSEIKEALGEKLHLLVHEVNQGKGIALKTAIKYYLESPLKTQYLGLVTADSDGQHEYPDVVNLDKKLGEKHERALHIGHRDLNSDIMPPRSKIGNKTTAWLFNLLYGVKLKDTQSGLRAFSNDILEWLLAIKGARFEYEMNMLILSKNADVKIYETPIKTKYEENHKSTYNTLRDSTRVAKVLLGGLGQFLLAAVAASLADLGGFALLYYLLIPTINPAMKVAVALLISQVTSRAVSSVVNFLVNRFLTFGGKRISKNSIWKYYVLWLGQLGASYGIVLGFTVLIGGGEFWIKMITDFLLSLLSYQIQMRWVFKKKVVKNKNKK
ncbi:MAG: bifunctional glycosyltransferase family 2/GtrA family protein [Clostridia bacterium]|nr:bifunctional glycosyltransferase family 2/GtrA family protein [Clostridia bacterium]